MKITRYQDPNDFYNLLKKTKFTSLEDNDFILGLTCVLCDNPNHYRTEPFLLTIEKDNQIQLAAFLTPPWPILIISKKTTNGQLYSFLAEYLIQNKIPISGVNAPANVSNLFSKIWCQKNYCTSFVKMNLNFFVLKQLQSVQSCPGQLIKADETDHDFVLDWAYLFHDEVKIDGNIDYVKSHVDHTIKEGHAFLWFDKEPVCMVFQERPHENSVSIGYVYTPKKFRKKGYATNCVAEVSKHSLGQGFKYCTLFTDATNPISNSIYQKIGYQYRCDYKLYNFIANNGV